MNERIKAHIEGLFQSAPRTKKIIELKEEIMSNCNCKYEDLIAGGATSDEAFKTVIAGIGDVSELISQLETGVSPDAHLVEQGKKRSALLVSLAVGLFILSPSWFIVFSWLGLSYELALFLMFVCIAGGVGLLIYNSMTKVEYNKTDETMVEEFREWKVQKDQKNSLRSNISAILWPSILIAYFLISFLTQAWYITWVLFIAGVMIEGIISVIFDLRKDK
ncbi:MAG: permease prefix domain 1-containing protein [Oscillospiraceae bacterium]|jgi:hypothetical protein|nr:hypothetical protein [Clostridiales bacterium]MDD4095996.1 permease prefix domain 1-containing protein [Oscillospiraceae bacterium]